MSAQPIERPVDQDVSKAPGESDGDGVVELGGVPQAVEIRRNAGVSLAIGGLASAIAIAYLYRAAGTGSLLDWAFTLLLGAMAFVFLRSLLDSRSPLLVADELGVRIRFGAQWRGVPWEAIDRVLVQPRRGVLRDGRVIIKLHHVARAIEGLEPRARRHAALNRKMYGAALAVPLGLTTRTTGDHRGDRELCDRIAELAQERAEVLVLVDDQAPLAPSEPPATTEEGERAVIDADAPHETERRSGWMRRSRTVTVTSDDATAAPEPELVDAEDERSTRSGSLARAIPFRIGAFGRGHVSAPVLPENESATSTAEDESVDEVESVVLSPATPVADPRVRSIATMGEPVAPLVIDDFVPEPAYDPVIGPELAAARTRVGLTVDSLAERTRIRPHVIESIEVDDFTPCGGDFYARGHIRTLARVLGKDPAPMLAQFDARYAQAPINARRVFEAELATGMHGGVRRTTGGPNWALLIGVVLTLVLVWSMVRLFAGQDNQMLENPPPVLNGSAGLNDVYGNAPSAPAVPPVQTTLTAVDAGTSVEVRDGEGNLVFEGDLVIGEVKTLRVVPPVTVSSDNGGALAVSLAGRDQGRLGEPDLPATRTFQRPGR